MLKELQSRFNSASLNYCDMHGLDRDQDWVMLKLLEEIGELTQVWNTKTGRGRDKGKSEEDLHVELSNEAADALGMILIFAHQHGLDLEAAIAHKRKFDPSDLTSPKSG